MHKLWDFRQKDQSKPLKLSYMPNNRSAHTSDLEEKTVKKSLTQLVSLVARKYSAAPRMCTSGKKIRFMKCEIGFWDLKHFHFVFHTYLKRAELTRTAFIFDFEPPDAGQEPRQTFLLPYLTYCIHFFEGWIYEIFIKVTKTNSSKWPTRPKMAMRTNLDLIKDWKKSLT